MHSEDGKDLSLVNKRLHGDSSLSTGCHDRRPHTNRRLDKNGSMIGPSRFATAAAAAAAATGRDEDDEYKNGASDHSSSFHIVHIVPQGENT